MDFDGLDAEVELLSDLAGAFALADELEGFEFAVAQALDGRTARFRTATGKILESFSGRRSESGGSPIERLSDREFEAFQLIGQGKGTRQIAEQLHLSVKTVEVHRQHIKEKLKLTDAPSLARYAVQWVESQGK